MILSRLASTDATDQHYDNAIIRMRSSITEAEVSGVDRDTLACLNCKLSEILFDASRHAEALDLAKRTLISLNVIDWRQKILQLRLFEIERQCLMILGKLDAARLVTERMNRLDDEVIGPHTTETVKRRLRSVQLDFGLQHFDKVVAEANRLKPDIEFILRDKDPMAYDLLLYMGISLIKAGDAELGRRYLRCAAQIEEDSSERALPYFAPEIINMQSNRTDILKLLNKTSKELK